MAVSKSPFWYGNITRSRWERFGNRQWLLTGQSSHRCSQNRAMPMEGGNPGLGEQVTKGEAPRVPAACAGEAPVRDSGRELPERTGSHRFKDTRPALKGDTEPWGQPVLGSAINNRHHPRGGRASAGQGTAPPGRTAPPGPRGPASSARPREGPGRTARFTPECSYLRPSPCLRPCSCSCRDLDVREGIQGESFPCREFPGALRAARDALPRTQPSGVQQLDTPRERLLCQRDLKEK